MPRAKAILQSLYPYNIGARCINREWFAIPMDEVWYIFTDELERTAKELNWTIHCFVLMNNHFHMIVSTPDANISTCMHLFMMRTSRRLTLRGNRINETYAGRHFKCILQHHNYFLNAYKYNYRNPVAAGLCKTVEEYPYSTLQEFLHPRARRVSTIDDPLLTNDYKKTLDWLNTAPDPIKLEGFRYGLKRQYFESKKDLNNRAIFSEHDLL